MSELSKVILLNVIPMFKGSTYRDTVTLTNDDGSPMDLSGYVVRSQLKTKLGEFVASFECTIPEPTTGVITRVMVETDTRLLTPSDKPAYAWGIELTGFYGEVLPEIQGGATVAPEIVTTQVII